MVQHTDKIVQNLLKLATSRSCSTSRNFFLMIPLYFWVQEWLPELLYGEKANIKLSNEEIFWQNVILKTG